MSNTQPFTSVTKNPAQSQVGVADQRLLIIGQLNGGTATSGELQENVLTTVNANSLFGNSMVTNMFKVARAVNPNTRIDVIGLADNGSGTDATGSVAFTGTATAAGTLVIRAGDYQDNAYSLTIASGTTAAAAATALVALVNADADRMVQASATSGTVTLTAINAGTEGNSIPVTVTGTVAGIGSTVTAMSGGAGDPDTTNVLDAIGQMRYQNIVAPSYARTAILPVLNDRWNVANRIQDGVLINVVNDTFANLLTLGNNLDTQNVVIFGNKSGAVQAPNYTLAAYLGGAISLRLTEGADLSDIVDGSTGLLDTTGGVQLASLPIFNTPLPSARFPRMAVNTEFTDLEVSQLNTAGISVFVNNDANTRLLTGAAVTPYKTNANGVENDTWHFLNAVQTTSAVSEYFFNGIKSRFAQHRLTTGATQAGRKTVNTTTIEGYIVRLYSEMIALQLVRDGDAFDFFRNNLTVTITNLQAGEIRITGSVPIVTQARTFTFPFNVQFEI